MQSDEVWGRFELISWERSLMQVLPDEKLNHFALLFVADIERIGTFKELSDVNAKDASNVLYKYFDDSSLLRILQDRTGIRVEIPGYLGPVNHAKDDLGIYLPILRDGVVVYSSSQRNENLSAEEARARHEEIRNYVRVFHPPNEFVDMVCLKYMGKTFTVMEIIKFVRHKLGGSHFGIEEVKGKERILDELFLQGIRKPENKFDSKLMIKFHRVAHGDILHGLVLGIASVVYSSRGMHELLAAVRTWKR